MKRYGSHEAIRALSLVLAAGSFVALLGANGAGKSTLSSFGIACWGYDPQRGFGALATRASGMVLPYFGTSA